jgi:SAM-dependent methyltransferase
MRELRTLLELRPNHIITRIDPADGMYRFCYQDQAYYFDVAQSALQCVRVALLLAGKDEVERILDLPSGHGRILRSLKAEFPAARLTACDITREAVDFCAEVLGANPVYAGENPAELKIEETFDLIWCGSLLTHLDEDRWRDVLTLFSAVLEPQGVLVFTTGGRYVAEGQRSGDIPYHRLSPDVLRGMLADYDRDGFGYRDFPDATGYGTAIATPSWVCSQLERFPGLKLLSYTERGWDRHQDVIACQRIDE